MGLETGWDGAPAERSQKCSGKWRSGLVSNLTVCLVCLHITFTLSQKERPFFVPSTYHERSFSEKMMENGASIRYSTPSTPEASLDVHQALL